MQLLLDYNDARDDGFQWQQTFEGSWIIHQEKETAYRKLCSLRTSSHCDFPHNSWSRMFEAIEQQFLLLSEVQEALTCFEEKGNESAQKKLIRKLPTKFGWLTKIVRDGKDLSAACWVTESGLKAPLGSLVKKFLKTDIETTDIHRYVLDLVIHDEERPYFAAKGLNIAESISNVLKATLAGSADVYGMTSIKNIITQKRIELVYTGNKGYGKERIREILRWDRSSPKSKLTQGRMGENELDLYDWEPVSDHVFDLGSFEVVRWEKPSINKYKLEYKNITAKYRKKIRELLEKHNANQKEGGWFEVCSKNISIDVWAPNLYHSKRKMDCIVIRFVEPTPSVCSFIIELMRAGSIMLLPMAFAADESVINSLDVEYPRSQLVTANELFEILSSGSLNWYEDDPN